MINKYTILILLAFIVLNTSYTFSQCIYKTPSGEKYHLSTCNVVKNVSTQVVELNDIQNINFYLVKDVIHLDCHKLKTRIIHVLKLSDRILLFDVKALQKKELNVNILPA